jgi:hypothetical protein
MPLVQPPSADKKLSHCRVAPTARGTRDGVAATVGDVGMSLEFEKKRDKRELGTNPALETLP